MSGAALSEDGKPNHCHYSRTKKDFKDCSFLKQGAGVVTTRGHIHYVVTEYGTAYLYGKTFARELRS
jgi:acyl-CoA hydrolase